RVRGTLLRRWGGGGGGRPIFRRAVGRAFLGRCFPLGGFLSLLGLEVSGQLTKAARGRRAFQGRLRELVLGGVSVRVWRAGGGGGRGRLGRRACGWGCGCLWWRGSRRSCALWLLACGRGGRSGRARSVSPARWPTPARWLVGPARRAITLGPVALRRTFSLL